MANECCYSNCSIIIPRLIYSGGDLAAAIILTALLVTGISVAIHIAVFYWIYKKKLQPQMMKTPGSSRQPKSSRSATGEGGGANVEHMVYEFMKDESSTTAKSAPIPAPKIKQNLAYGKVKMPEGGQN